MPNRKLIPLTFRQRLAALFARSLRPAWLVGGLGLACTVALWLLTVQVVRNEAQERFQDVAGLFVARFDQTMTAYEQVLRGARALVSTQPDLSRTDFVSYVERLDLDQSYPGIQAVGLTVLIPAAEKDAHEREMRAEGVEGYAITPAGERRMYSSIIRIAPESRRNQRAIGYDMYSEALRRTAMDEARDMNTPILSSRVTLVQEMGSDVQPGFLLYFPVYRTGPPPQSLDQRRQDIRAFVYAPFRAGKLFDGVISAGHNAAGQLFDFVVYDGTNAAPDHLLYTSKRLSDEPHAAKFVVTRDRVKFGRAWRMVFNSTKKFEAGVDYSKAYIAVLASLLGTLMLAGFVAAMALRQEVLAHANAQMSLLTRELSHRVKNTLAVVQSIATRSLSDGRSVAEARSVFMKRLHALARAHTLLLEMSWRGASLRQLAEQELEPFAARAMIVGPDIALNASVAQTFALVLHELATNATKHGALSRPSGRVFVNWRIEPHPTAGHMFHFTWREAGGPTVREPTHRGFGRTLLSQHVGHGGERPLITYAPEGLRYEVSAPFASVTTDAVDEDDVVLADDVANGSSGA